VRQKLSLDRDAPTRGTVAIQALLGAGSYTSLAMPYVRRVSGLQNLDKRQRHLFVSNHVSLLDTILLGGLMWRHGFYPILVLGDKTVWHGSLIKRMLSSKIGFLLERGKHSHERINELEAFGRAIANYQLVVFPEGTRGDGENVGSCQPGIYHIAQEAHAPIVPIFIANMQRVSARHERFHALSGLRQIEVCFGAPIAANEYLQMPRDEFTEFVRTKIAAQRPTP
jgi:1-acyl-sn-glycerol-3-phosphate acyltransferase